jgi:selenocysteine lyase/cysteine desulfurase
LEEKRKQKTSYRIVTTCLKHYPAFSTNRPLSHKSQTTSKMSKDNSSLKKNFMNLECGTSLAELEYSSDYHQNQWKTEEKKNDEVLSPLAESSLEGNLRSIRSHLANDIITNGCVPLFTSPYETPEAHSATGQTAIPEKERYVSVPLIYCDQTASNRPLKSVESYIQNVCLPFYGNTHTNTSVTGSQSTAFVAEARQIVAEVCNAKVTGKAALDVVLFAGNGATSVVELLIDCLGIKYYSSEEATRPVVFVGPYEHHSNLLPWRESGCEIVMIPECQNTQNVDISYLEQMLQSSSYSGKRLKMGAFTAASNVTGKVTDVDAIAATLHKYGALAFFDYATGAPYLPINMNPFPHGKYTTADVAKDAIFVSPHKMIGGVQTPGILIIKKHLVNQTIPPKRSGGGTVFYVTHKHHRFLSNRIERYEGGTPNVVGIFRAGLAFLVKRSIEIQYLKAIRGANDHERESFPPTLIEYEFETHRYMVQRLKRSAPNIIILGSADDNVPNNCLPIFSFLIKCGDKFLHYNYVCAILNDLFGIQSRGGCQVSFL